tara:strand:- start:10787 stop:11809 length:1023 start_codon:yes stop_codon:yes gene_type:complete
MNRNLNKTIKYSLIKICLIPISLLIISSLVFLLLRIAPGDPVDAILGSGATLEARETLRANLGLNESIISQYFTFLKNLSHLNFGDSLSNQEPVIQIIGKSLPASLELGFVSFVFAILLGFPLGYLGLKNKEKNLDGISRIIGISSYAIPPFWGAMMAQLLFSVVFRIFPIGGRFPIFDEQPSITGFIILDSLLTNNFSSLAGALYHIALPSLTLGFLLSGVFSRSFRLNLEKSLQSDFVEAAVCRGINDRNILYKYALPNALIPILTISGVTLASLAGGALLIEITFSWPGIALRLQEAIFQRDYNLVQGIVIVTSFLIVSLNLIIDILIAFFDPRIKY